jgi:hypothetical protein
MKPRLDVLPPPQRRFWPVLSELPDHFVLYGGTAIGLRLGGRQSVDFDFFTNQSISADVLSGSLPFLRAAELIQSDPNTLTFTVHRRGEIKISSIESQHPRSNAKQRHSNLTLLSLSRAKTDKTSVLLYKLCRIPTRSSHYSSRHPQRAREIDRVSAMPPISQRH